MTPAVTSRHPHPLAGRPLADRIHRSADPGPVLLIDDDESVRTAIAGSLQALGVSDITLAADGETGLKLLEKLHTPILILDLLMPGTGGFEVLERISRFPALRPHRVVVMTALDDPIVEIGVIGLGADVVLRKPYRLVDLFEAITGA